MLKIDYERCKGCSLCVSSLALKRFCRLTSKDLT